MQKPRTGQGPAKWKKTQKARGFGSVQKMKTLFLSPYCPWLTGSVWAIHPASNPPQGHHGKRSGPGAA